MKYKYFRTKDFKVALDWVHRNQFKDNVFFRFSYVGYICTYRTPWMSSSQCLDYMRYFREYDEFTFLTMRLCA